MERQLAVALDMEVYLFAYASLSNDSTIEDLSAMFKEFVDRRTDEHVRLMRSYYWHYYRVTLCTPYSFILAITADRDQHCVLQHRSPHHTRLPETLLPLALPWPSQEVDGRHSMDRAVLLSCFNRVVLIALPDVQALMFFLRLP